MLTRAHPHNDVNICLVYMYANNVQYHTMVLELNFFVLLNRSHSQLGLGLRDSAWKGKAEKGHTQK